MLCIFSTIILIITERLDGLFKITYLEKKKNTHTQREGEREKEREGTLLHIWNHKQSYSRFISIS